MVSGLVYLYDASPINVRDRRVLLEDQLRRVGMLDDWEVRATPSRNALLVSLYADAAGRPARASVTLIDLRAETGDLEQIGFKVCDRITRHPSLRRATRPGVAAERKAIAEGLHESLEIIARHGLDPKEAMALVALTQYTDMIRALGEGSNTNTILLPHSPSSVGDIMSQIRDGILVADAATETNGQPRAIPRRVGDEEAASR